MELDLFEFVTLKVALEDKIKDKLKTLKIFKESVHDYDLTSIENDIKTLKCLYSQLVAIQRTTK